MLLLQLVLLTVLVPGGDSDDGEDVALPGRCKSVCLHLCDVCHVCTYVVVYMCACVYMCMSMCV